jgi:hypothetical protein
MQDAATDPEVATMPSKQFGRCWDYEDCPREDCDGELSQQDRINVLCLSCERVWTHLKTDDKHKLKTADCETAAEKPIAITDGGKRSGDEGEQSPLDRLFVEDAAERPDAIVVDELTTMDAAAFVDRLESLAAAAEAVETLVEDLERLRQTGLSDDDARDLLYGRNSTLAKRDIEAMFEAVDQLADGRADRPAERLLSEISGLTLSETSALMDELDRLNRLYGGVADE